MKVKLVRIGNSRGIRLPKSVIEQCGFRDSVEVTVRGEVVEIAPARRPRDGWDEAFARMAASGDDRPLDVEGAPSTWDRREWWW